jgi:hypothetical protein
VHEGKIIEHWGVANLYSLMQQLGALPSDARAWVAVIIYPHGGTRRGGEFRLCAIDLNLREPRWVLEDCLAQTACNFAKFPLG